MKEVEARFGKGGRKAYRGYEKEWQGKLVYNTHNKEGDEALR